MQMNSGHQTSTGVLFQRRARLESRAHQLSGLFEAGAGAPRNSHRLAFVCLLLFTLLLYVRPNDLFPGIFGALPIAKFAMLGALLAYLVSKLARGESLTVWPLELKMLLVIVALAIGLLPAAVAPLETINVLTDQFLKVICVFILMINLLTTRRRLRALLGLLVVCGSVMGMDAVRRYLAGEFTLSNSRIEGYVGIFSDPNDLAAGLDILLPLAIVLALTTRRKPIRLLFFACAAVLGIGTLATFSRGGFLGLIVAGGLLVWKLSRGHRVRTVLITTLMLTVFLVAMPGNYRERLATIFNPEADKTTSAQERQKVLKNAAQVAARRFIVGVGMGNFTLYSIKDLKAHNSYLEILAELGVVGLVAYLILMLRPLRSLQRIEAASAHDSALPRSRDSREFYCLSVGLEGAILSYMVCSFFLSLEYFWHIYYPVACAIALRQIHAVEADVPMADASPARSGVLWQSRLKARPRPTQPRSIYLIPGAGRN